MVEVSVVVVNFNGANLLYDCLRSLGAQTFRDFEVLLVDNGSADNSVASAKSLLPEVRCLALAENVGFAKGSNIGIAESRGKYLVLLNNDTQAEPAFLSELIRVAENDPDAGMAAPKILDFFDRSRIDSVGGLVVSGDGLGQGRGRGELDRGQYDPLTEILAPSACAALYRREMLDEIGLFDEGFFMYCEDLDLGLRGRWAGWKAVSAPCAVVYHKYSASSGPYSPLKMHLVERNHYLVALKNFPARAAALRPDLERLPLCVDGTRSFSCRGDRRSRCNVALLAAFVQGHAEAVLSGVVAFHRRTRLRRLSAREFVTLLKRHRLSLGRLISSK